MLVLGLGPRQLILGPNGAGKSTLFEILRLLQDFCVRGEPPDEQFGGRSRTRWQDVAVQTFELDVEGNGGIYKLRLEIDIWGNPARPRVIRESLDFSGVCIFQFSDGEVNLFNDKLDGAS
jgi:energy-coupling factor transporter ATP-binding protein EcfA2